MSGKEYGSVRMAYEVKNLMDKLGIKNAHIVGHSLGGRVALRFGEIFPDRTLSVTVGDMHVRGYKTPAHSQDEEDWKEEEALLRQHRSQNQPPPLAGTKAQTIAPVATAPRSEGGSQSWNEGPEREDDYYREETPTEKERYKYLADSFNEDLTPALKWTTAPVLFVRGSFFLNDSDVRWIKAVRPDAEIHELKEKGHAVHKNPAFVEIFDAFAKAHSDPKPNPPAAGGPG
jgi:pimeloyl-ACP methyl ester carboxylesterase